NVFIHNQTKGYVYITDSLPEQGRPSLYNTLLINDKMLAEKVGAFIPNHDSWPYFLPERKYKGKAGKLTLYFIGEQDVAKPYSEIRSGKLYRSLNIELPELAQNELNHVFCFEDSISVEHRYDVETVEKPK